MLSRFEDGTGGGSGQEAGQPLFQDALQVVMHPEELHPFLGALVAEKHPVVKEWTIPPPASSDAERHITRSGAYVPLKNLGFQSAYPVLQGYKEYAGLGYHAHIDDPLTLATIVLLIRRKQLRRLSRLSIWRRDHPPNT